MCRFLILNGKYKFDSLIGWEVLLPVEIPGYKVTLVQQPGFDFYDSFFEVIRSDGKKTNILIDSDDDNWWNPNVIRKDGRIYFVRGSGKINDGTAFVDPENGIIFSGYLQQTHVLSELEFN